MMLTFGILILAASVCFVMSLRVSTIPCGGKVTEVRAFGCKNEAEPCVIQRGNKGRLEVDFEAPFAARSLYADVRGRTGSALLPIYIPWNGLHKDACTGHGIQCPIKRNNKYTYVYEMKVDEQFPKFRTDYVWKLTDFWGFTVACFRMDLEIV